ncbi:acyl-CoA dehydrogenase [Kribbella sp. NPDC051587]|uniref:acyl-CoA dehydrogenase n=1 Tax=Kribbella sp. NPDC051587 TaxID=3364119 RepID=UPI0037BA819C
MSHEDVSALDVGVNLLDLGSPRDPTSLFGFEAVLAADERAELSGEAELRALRLAAEFVPAEFGGRFTRLDRLVEVGRELYRRDPALALANAGGPFIASLLVWQAGDTAQRQRCADALLSGEWLAVAVTELAHGNDLTAAELSATRAEGGWELHGRKELITNAERADAMVVFARTDPAGGPRAHSLMWLDRGDEDSLVTLPRYGTDGVRGVKLGGFEFTGHLAPTDAVLGQPGSGLEHLLKAFQVTRTSLPAMAVGVLDTALRIAVEHLTERTLYRGRAVDLPHVRAELVGAYRDLLTAEVVSAVGVRVLHLAPRAGSVSSAVVKFVVSGLLLSALDRVADLLGAYSYLREGPTGMVQKLLRDVRLVGFGHVARAACQMSLLPQLPLLAKRSWSKPPREVPGLFDVDGEIAPLRFDAFAVNASGFDPVTSTLHGTPELQDLAEVCSALPPSQLGVDAAPAHYDLTTRYAELFTKACVLRVFGTETPHHQDDEQAFTNLLGRY